MGAGKDLWDELQALHKNHDLSGYASLYATDAVLMDPSGRHEGREAIMAYIEEAERPFPDLTMETCLVIGEGETVVGEWIYRATHTATGKAVEFPGASICELRDGKISVRRDYFDTAALMSQLGLMPKA
jgi:ketosteroid isomerase-like protein